jgi:uncharacterized protein with HEPN domain
VLQSCQAINQYTTGLDFADYMRDPMVRDAVERRLGIIGEALHRAVDLDPELAERVPELREIVGLRNRVIHGYDAVDDRIVWDIVQNELPLLRAQVQALLDEAGSS